MSNKHEVLKAFSENPQATSGELAKILGCGPAYVRATLSRNGKKLAGARDATYYRRMAEKYRAIADEMEGESS